MTTGKDIADVLDSKTAQKAYDDGLSTPVKEGGKILTDGVKTLRLLGAPLQLAAGFQDRLEEWIDRVVRKIPEERLQPVPARLGGPVIQELQYLDDGDSITEMYLHLLNKAMDKETEDVAHPAFAKLIGLLSPDEVLMLHLLGQRTFEEHYESDLDNEARRFHNKRITLQEFPVNDLAYPNNFYIYTSHLTSLDLIAFPIYKQEATWHEEEGIKRQKGELGFARLHLTDFGRMFVNACQPGETL